MDFLIEITMRKELNNVSRNLLYADYKTYLHGSLYFTRAGGGVVEGRGPEVNSMEAKLK